MSEKEPLLRRVTSEGAILNDDGTTRRSDAAGDKKALLNQRILVAKSTINPRDVGVAFLRKHGAPIYDWATVQSISGVPFSNSTGLSEAVMFHCVLDIKVPSKDQLDHSSPGTPTNSGTGSTRGSAAVGTGGATTSGSSGLSNSATRRMKDLIVRKLSLSTKTSTGLQHPPSVCVIKHYDTSNVETPTLALRAARLMMSLTAEQMAKNEIFFYAEVQPMLTEDAMVIAESLGSGFAARNATPNLVTANLLFLAHKDRGDPGILRYVCCRSGSGSTTTIGLEDLSQAGFSFVHNQEDGLYDAAAIRGALLALASFHSSLWGRFDKAQLPSSDRSQKSSSLGSGGGSASIQRERDDPSLQSSFIPSGFEIRHPTARKVLNPPPASIARFVHRCGRKAVEKMNHNNDLPACVPSLTELIGKWGDYWPILKHTEVQKALRKVYTNWSSIRADAVRIVLTNQTVLHGDFHHKNIGFRRSTSTPLARRHWSKEYSSSEDPETYEAKRVGRSSPRAEEGAEPVMVDVCAFDFQGCGTGHVAHEILYFLCCSLPVDVFLETTSGKEGQVQGSSQGAVRSASSQRPQNGSQQPTTGAKPVQVKQAERAKREHQFTLAELRELDNAILREYHGYLAEGVQARYPLAALVEDVHILVQHWAGCLLMDMAMSSVDERFKLKNVPGLRNLLEWAEKTATRVLWSVTSILNSGGGVRRSVGSTGSTVDSMLSSSFGATTTSGDATTSSAKDKEKEKERKESTMEGEVAALPPIPMMSSSGPRSTRSE
jgi:hypothetical protein